MPSGNVDNPYIIKFKLVDINNKTIDCPDKFSYQFSNSNTTFTDYDCQNQNLYINNSFTIIDEYSFIIPMMNKTYSFYINHGEPILSTNCIKILNYTEKIILGQNTSITISLDFKDKYNNSIPIEEIIKNLVIMMTSGMVPNFLSLKTSENGLLKYSTNLGLISPGYYMYAFSYNNSQMIIIPSYVTTVIRLPFFPNTKFTCASQNYENNSLINCTECSSLQIIGKDQNDKQLNTIEYKVEGYLYNNNNYSNNLDIIGNEEDYRCRLNCTNLNNDTFLLFKIIGGNGSSIFSFGLY